MEREQILNKINYVTKQLEDINTDVNIVSKLWLELKELYKQLKDHG